MARHTADVCIIHAVDTGKATTLRTFYLYVAYCSITAVLECLICYTL